METPQPPLPRPPGDAENLRRLRQEAAERMRQDEPLRAEPRPVYGGPAPVYGGPPITRRWTTRGILKLMVGALAALVAGLWAFRRATAPAYGGPPAPVYGGPPPPQPQPQPPADPK